MGCHVYFRRFGVQRSTYAHLLALNMTEHMRYEFVPCAPDFRRDLDIDSGQASKNVVVSITVFELLH